MSNEATPRIGDETASARRLVLSMLRDELGLTRIELARRTGLSPTTITRVVSSLLDEGRVAEGARVVHHRSGRPGRRVGVVADACGVVGVHVGVGTVRCGVVDAVGQDQGRTGFDFDPDKSAETVLARVADVLVQLLRDQPTTAPRRILGVGVAVPGPVDEAGRRLLMPINLDWSDVAVADILEAAVDLPVVVEHNVRAMALAEAWSADGRGRGSVGYVYLRTGLGAGLVVAGRGFQGGVHGAVEVGHLRVVEGGARCVCGGNGCLETVVSDRGLRQVLETIGTEIVDGEPLASLVAESGHDPAAASALDGIVLHLATGLSALMNLLNPEVIYLGGALARVPDAFVERLAAATRDAVFPVIRPAVSLQRSGLSSDPGVDGAAVVALDHYVYS